MLCQEDPAAVEELPTSVGGSVRGALLLGVGGFLTVAHVVSKCLLMARELESERGVPSEPPTELIPFQVVNRAILVVRTICHLRSERASFAVVVTEDRTRDFSQAESGGQQIPPCAGHGNSSASELPLRLSRGLLGGSSPGRSSRVTLQWTVLAAIAHRNDQTCIIFQVGLCEEQHANTCTGAGL